MTTQPAFSHDRRRARAQVLPVVLLLLAMLLAQTLGFIHRTVHYTPASSVAVGQSAETQAAQAPAVKARGFLASLFHHNEDDPSCRVFDQAGHADALACPPAIALPMAVTSFELLFFEGEVLARWVALFDARGPPPVR